MLAQVSRIGVGRAVADDGKRWHSGGRFNIGGSKMSEGPGEDDKVIGREGRLADDGKELCGREFCSHCGVK